MNSTKQRARRTGPFIAIGSAQAHIEPAVSVRFLKDNPIPGKEYNK
jgi:hypothetical protein